MNIEHTRILELSECSKMTDLALEKISTCKNLVKLDLVKLLFKKSLYTNLFLINLFLKNSNSLPRESLTSSGKYIVAFVIQLSGRQLFFWEKNLGKC